LQVDTHKRLTTIGATLREKLRLAGPCGISEDAFRFDLDAHEAAYDIRARVCIDRLFRSKEPFELFRWRLHDMVFGNLAAGARETQARKGHPQASS
jgi:hypothetical protein